MSMINDDIISNKLIEAYHSIKSNDALRYQDNIYNISELIYCLAKSYYFRVNKENPIINGKMLSGTLVHQLIEKALSDLNIKYEVECIRDYNDYKIVGHADAVDDDTVYEFKFSGAKLNGNLPFYYFMQANAYSVMLDRPHFKIIYINSYSLNITSVTGNQDKDAFKYIENQAAYLHDCLKSKRVPIGPAYDWECSHCQFKLICKNKKKEVDKVERPRKKNVRADKRKSRKAN